MEQDQFRKEWQSVCELLISSEERKKILPIHISMLFDAHNASFQKHFCSFIAPSFASLLLLLFTYTFKRMYIFSIACLLLLNIMAAIHFDITSESLLTLSFEKARKKHDINNNTVVECEFKMKQEIRACCSNMINFELHQQKSDSDSSSDGSA